MLSFEYCCISHIGDRPNHEDNFLLNRKYLTPSEQSEMKMIKSVCYDDKISSNIYLFAISDGMGGHNAGEEASLICVSRLAEIESTIKKNQSIEDVVSLCQDVISSINIDVCRKGHENTEYRKMGATLVMFIMHETELSFLNLGDSRAYFYDGSSLVQITKDNTEGQRMLDMNLLTCDEVENFIARKNLNKYIGIDRPGLSLRADEYYMKAKNGIYILCSDGVSDLLSDNEIMSHLKNHEHINVVAKNIIDDAVAKDGSDNATIIIILIGE